MLENVKKFCDDPEEQKVIEQMVMPSVELSSLVVYKFAHPPECEKYGRYTDRFTSVKWNKIS